MKLIVNGEEKKFSDNATLQEIIRELKIEDMEVVKKDEWSRFTPNDGDKLELLQFVGGG